MTLILLYAGYLPFEEWVLSVSSGTVYVLLRFIPEILIYAVMIATLLNRVLRTGKWLLSGIDGILLTFLLIVVISMAVNHISPYQTLLAARPLLRYIAVFLIVIHASRLPDTGTVFQLLIVTGCVQAILGLLQATGLPEIQQLFVPTDVMIGDQLLRQQEVAFWGKHVFISGTLVRYGIYGAFLAFTISALFARNASAGKRLTVTSWIARLVSMSALFLSFSRKAWLAVVAVWAGIQILNRRTHRLILPGLVGMVSLTAILLLMGMVPWESSETSTNPLIRITGMFSIDYLKFTLERTRLYILTSAAWNLILTAPFFGLGPGEIGSAVTGTAAGTTSLLFSDTVQKLPFFDERLRLVSDVGLVSILGQYGLTGLAAILAMFYRLHRIGLSLFRRSKEQLQSGLGLLLVCLVWVMIIENLLGFALTYRVTSYYFWLVAGFACRIHQQGFDYARLPDTQSREGITA